MSFIRKQEKKFALKLLEWRYKQQELPLPEKRQLRAHAERIVADAHEIAKERGGNVLAILKEMISSKR